MNPEIPRGKEEKEQQQTTAAEILALINAHEEWLLIDRSMAAGKSFALRRNEIEIESARGKTLFSFLDEKGFQTWRIADWKCDEKSRLHFNLSRNFDKEHRKIELVPRVLAAELAVSIELARQKKAIQTANLIVENFPKTKLVRVALNKNSGRFAQIIFENHHAGAGKQTQTAALADVSGEAATELLLTTAILWLEKLQSRRKNKVENIWILAERKIARDLQKSRALLRGGWQSKLEILEISDKDEKAPGESSLNKLEKVRLSDLWQAKPKKIKVPENAELSETAREILALSPEEIDVVFSKHGETLRFLGLPFARVRKIFGEEKAWFGTAEGKREILNEKTRADFLKLIENLKIYRRFDSPNKRHIFYTSAPESWLEAVLRRNIKKLDANLILSPVYQQFRVSGGVSDRIDLLALRRDRRLVVIELKTAPDREMIFQAMDYWRKIEKQRRAGNLQKAKIFGAETKMISSDEKTIVYLAAPTLSFHRDFNFFAKTISPEIEIVRFCLNENWRAQLKVMKREEMLSELNTRN